MKILLLGPNGAVVRLVLDEVLKSNHEVTALVRSAAALQTKHPRFSAMQGTPTHAVDLDKALIGQDAVLSTLGARTNARTTLRRDVAKNLVAGMKKYGARRLIRLDAAGVGSSKEFVQRSSFLFGRIVMPFFLNHMYDDAALADDIIEKSDCEW